MGFFLTMRTFGHIPGVKSTRGFLYLSLIHKLLSYILGVYI